MKYFFFLFKHLTSQSNIISALKYKKVNFDVKIFLNYTFFFCLSFGHISPAP